MQPEHDALTDERVPYTLCWFGAVSEIPIETVPDINEPGQAAAMLAEYFAAHPDDEPGYELGFSNHSPDIVPGTHKFKVSDAAIRNRNFRFGHLNPPTPYDIDEIEES